MMLKSAGDCAALLSQPPMHFDSCDLENVFREVFFSRYQTLLCGGGEEPFYSPASAVGDAVSRIHYTRDYFASALHEVAHWCIAGAARRKLEDFGYWYAADGRSDDQQRAFEQVEVKPQALECIFSTACGHPFRVSADNLASGKGPAEEFVAAIVAQVETYRRQGLPTRAGQFAHYLAEFYQQPRDWLEQLDTKEIR